MIRLFFMGVVLLGLALAHSPLRSATPGPNSTLRALPESITINFNEKVQVRFSTFKVYPLNAPREAWGNFAELRRLARPLVRQVLAPGYNAARRVDAGLNATSPTTYTVELALRQNLQAGPHVVLWRTRSIDGHSETDFFVFVYQP